MAKITYEIQFARDYYPEMTVKKKKQIHTIIELIERIFGTECDPFCDGMDYNFENLHTYKSDAVIESFFDIHYTYKNDNYIEIRDCVHEFFEKIQNRYEEAEFDWYLSE